MDLPATSRKPSPTAPSLPWSHRTQHPSRQRHLNRPINGRRSECLTTLPTAGAWAWPTLQRSCAPSGYRDTALEVCAGGVGWGSVPRQPCRLELRIRKRRALRPSTHVLPEATCSERVRGSGSCPSPQCRSEHSPAQRQPWRRSTRCLPPVGKRGLSAHTAQGLLRLTRTPSPKAWNGPPLRFLHSELPCGQVG